MQIYVRIFIHCLGAAILFFPFFHVLAGVQSPPTSSSLCDQQESLFIANFQSHQISAAEQAARRLVISKRYRRLVLLNAKNEIVFDVPVAFGFGYLLGPKQFEGDGKTPEGLYSIDKKSLKTSYYRSLRISYPNRADEDFAKEQGRAPGGLILIHGFPTLPIGDLTPEYVQAVHPDIDWTKGCVAMTNDQVAHLYKVVTIGTPVEICPL